MVFEASDWIGGHTHTVDVEVKGERYAIDTGFIVFNDWTYPNFIRLLDQLGVASQPTEMSFSVQDPRSGTEYNGNNLNSLFAQRRNLLSPSFWGMLRDILRFNREALRDLREHRITADTTLGAYLRQNGYGLRFIEHYIVPMGSAIWSMSLGDMQGFPLQFFVRFCKNHGLLSATHRPQWRVVSGGSRSYVAPLSAGFVERVRLNCPVYRVVRDMAGVNLHSSAGNERFDTVVFACHSDQALCLLAAPNQAERGDTRRTALRRERRGAAHRHPSAAEPPPSLGKLELPPRRLSPATGRCHLQHEYPARVPERHHLLR